MLKYHFSYIEYQINELDCRDNKTKSCSSTHIINGRYTPTSMVTFENYLLLKCFYRSSKANGTAMIISKYYFILTSLQFCDTNYMAPTTFRCGCRHFRCTKWQFSETTNSYLSFTITFSLTLFHPGGGSIWPPPRFFQNNSQTASAKTSKLCEF